MNIAFFDSGIGGLTSLAYFIKKYPGHTYHYFADFAGFPYGNKSYEQLVERCKQNIAYLIEKEVTHIVVACNTATVIVQELIDLYPEITFVFGVDIAIAQAAAVTENKRIGLFATSYVVNAQMYPAKMKEYASDVTIIQEACPTLASIIENGNPCEIASTIAFHMTAMQQADIDTLILGCTHYGYATQYIREIMPKIQIVFSDEHYRFFDEHQMNISSSKELQLFIYSSLPFDILCNNVQSTLYALHADAYIVAE